jgi:hypothetical protein
MVEWCWMVKFCFCNLGNAQDLVSEALDVEVLDIGS